MEDEVVDVRADAEREPPAPTVLEAVVKAISDLDDLVRALAQGLSRAKPWQRQLVTRLAEIDRLLQILRMTVALKRADDEIRRAAESLYLECRGVGLAVSGTRSDRATKAAVRLVADLAARIRITLRSAAEQ